MKTLILPKIIDMRTFNIIALFVIIILAIFQSKCKYLQEIQAFSKCEFRLKGVQIQSLDNIDVTQMKSVSDFDVLTISKLGSALLQGRMPISFRTYVEARNPNNQKASIGQLLVIVLFNDNQILQTQINKRVEILPHKTAVIPLDFHTDLGNLLKGENIRNILGLLFPGTETPAVFTFKIKPTVLIGPVTINYPGYITLTKDFKSQ